MSGSSGLAMTTDRVHISPTFISLDEAIPVPDLLPDLLVSGVFE